MSQPDRSLPENLQPAQPENKVVAGTELHSVSHNDALADAVLSAPETRVMPAPIDTDIPSEGIPREIGGRGGLEPTRFGDWEKNGRCIDF